MVIDINLRTFFPDLELNKSHSGKNSIKQLYSAEDIASRCQTLDYSFDKDSVRTDCFRNSNKTKKLKH